MESLSNKAKPKKRKTRKCLDKIRKRSRRTGQILFEQDSGKVCDHFAKYSIVNNCPVTNNRLTLRMFPKAVRSETITRPALADLKENPNLNFNDLVKGTNGSKVISTLSSTNVRMPDELFDNFENSIEHLKSESFMFSNKSAHRESEINMSCQEEKLPSNIDLFPYKGSVKLSDKSSDSIGAQSVSTLTTSSNQSFLDDYRYKFYEDFMSKLPTYLKKDVTHIEEDVMKETKMYLQNLFIETCYQECEENVLKCKKGNTTNRDDYTPPSETIVHNPMDYIRLGHVQRQSLVYRPSGIGSIDGGCSIPHSPLLGPSLPAASPDSPLNVIGNDTPDYTYYPHRLN